MTPPRGVLWDLDGTLVDSEPLHDRALTDVLNGIGCPIPHHLHEAMLGISIDDVWVMLRAEFDLAIPLAEFARLRDARYLELVAGGLKPRTGALDILSAIARAGLPQAIVSNSERVIVDANVAAAGLGPFDLRSISRDDVERPKPDPEPYRLGAALLGVPVEACVVVEDSPTGVLAGLAAGAQVIAWATPGSSVLFDSSATRIESAAAVRQALGV